MTIRRPLVLSLSKDERFCSWFDKLRPRAAIISTCRTHHTSAADIRLAAMISCADVVSAPVSGILAGAVVGLLFVTPSAAQDESTRRARPSLPAPRWPDGTINLGAPPGDDGKWEGAEPLATDPNNYEAQLGPPAAARPYPHRRCAAAAVGARTRRRCGTIRFLADEPYTRCKPSPGPRSFGTAYGVELLNLPGSERVYLFMTGGAHSFRVDLHGRTVASDDVRSRAPSATRSAGGTATRW